jgi:hypothetical protein
MWARTVVSAAGIVVLVAIGVVIGRVTEAPVPAPPALLQADNNTDDGPPVPGTREATGQNNANGARVHVIVTPANGWLGIEVESASVANGQRCRLFAYDRAGKAYEFGGWVAGDNEAFPIYGAVMLPPAELASVAVLDDQNKKLVTAAIPPL